MSHSSKLLSLRRRLGEPPIYSQFMGHWAQATNAPEVLEAWICSCQYEQLRGTVLWDWALTLWGPYWLQQWASELHGAKGPHAFGVRSALWELWAREFLLFDYIHSSWIFKLNQIWPVADPFKPVPLTFETLLLPGTNCPSPAQISPSPKGPGSFSGEWYYRPRSGCFMYSLLPGAIALSPFNGHS